MENLENNEGPSESGARDFFKKLWNKILYIVLSPYRFFKFVCFSMGLISLSAIFLAGAITFNFFNSFPKIDKMDYSDLKKRAIDRVVKKLGTKDKIKKFRWTPIDQISRDLIYSIVMSEDGHFFKHSGVDYNSLLDSLAQNIKKREYSTGASTITQQVVKNIFLHNGKTLTRKLREIMICRDIERRFTKNQILEIYLNIAEFGPDIYGVKHASKNIFKKLPKDINVAEGAYLGVLLPSPRKYYYTVFQNGNLTPKKKKKIKRVLRDMHYNEFITYDQYLSYLKYKY